MEKQLFVYIWNSDPKITTIVTAESFEQAKEIIRQASVLGEYPGLPSHIIKAPRGAQLEFSEKVA